jgi:hypothetical protein
MVMGAALAKRKLLRVEACLLPPNKKTINLHV